MLTIFTILDYNQAMTPTLAQIQAFFGDIAADYETQIVAPAFGPFAQAVIQTAQPQGHELVLDIGTGTGILARLISPYVQAVIGIDLAPSMIEQGRIYVQREGLANVRLEVANAHHCPYPDSHFELIVSSFGLNATSPSLVLGEIGRLLKPEGVLAFHEWHEQHPLDYVLVDVMADYMLGDDEVTEDLLALREFVRSPRPWDNVFQTAQDYQETLQEHRFEAIQVWEDAPVELLLSIPDFLRYKLAWKNRREELAAMPTPQRADCLDALRDTLEQWADGEGLLHYAPKLFRVLAVKGNTY